MLNGSPPGNHPWQILSSRLTTIGLLLPSTPNPKHPIFLPRYTICQKIEPFSCLPRNTQILQKTCGTRYQRRYQNRASQNQYFHGKDVQRKPLEYFLLSRLLLPHLSLNQGLSKPPPQ